MQAARLLSTGVSQLPRPSGPFRQVLQRTAFEERGLECNFTESFYTDPERTCCAECISGAPAYHAKLVYCMSGSIWDVALDLRIGSPIFGEHEAYDLSAEYNNAAYLPRGIAHGFFVWSAPAVVVYHVTSEHIPEHDKGIRWDTLGAKWPQSAPVISLRDESLVPLAQFESSFRFDPNMASNRGLK
jgi:dTDP-4-dehydrorhamnose 3,5-epimerase